MVPSAPLSKVWSGTSSRLKATSMNGAERLLLSPSVVLVVAIDISMDDVMTFVMKLKIHNQSTVKSRAQGSDSNIYIE